MNYKNLNYEIETGTMDVLRMDNRHPMNYKNLNYEIETVTLNLLQVCLAFL